MTIQQTRWCDCVGFDDKIERKRNEGKDLWPFGCMVGLGWAILVCMNAIEICNWWKLKVMDRIDALFYLHKASKDMYTY